ncbi:DUF1648 domain-containing protein [Spongiactinospora sp. TRM90649]|uniref:DUF1648 domain-containing protein n=1 Tax=Spongiactinospora sp. TRM90649 TaxID=3031114 RepID=UPI0023F80EBD|nr:DUF1648 domain-containing protein [Spongiactinospora sp. TRM90649]MDF5758521.1 DUF1648 domain-containing protein [Spongiactinospora sp. TRM90649]
MTAPPSSSSSSSTTGGGEHAAFTRRVVATVASWYATVTAVLVVVPLLLRDRLPDPLAMHWGPSGAPDQSASFTTVLIVPLVLWHVLWGVLAGLAVFNTRLARRRATRIMLGAGLAASGAFVVGMQALTLLANLDRDDWRQAAHIGPAVLLAIVVAAVAGWLGATAARPGPDENPARDAAGPAPTVRLRPGERGVWVSSATNQGTMLLAFAFGALTVPVAVLALIGLPGYVWAIAGLFALIGLAGAALSSVRAQVTEAGLAVAFGPWRRPVRRYPLATIESARAETRQPHTVGGWGYRGLPGAATIMVRGGDCLVVTFVSGRELGISVDDAARGAGLLNTLRAERAAS